MTDALGIHSIPLPADLEFEFAPKKGVRPLLAQPLREFIADEENALVTVLWRGLEEQHPTFCPLVLAGPTGCGKTVLALALARRYKEFRPQAKIVSLTAADFARAYAHAVDTDALGEFRTRFQTAALVVLDDVQHLEGKRGAQQELRQLLDGWSRRQISVIVTSRVAPLELPFTADLRSRLTPGLVVPLRWPGNAAREEMIARYLAGRGSSSLSREAIARLATAYAGPPTRLFAALAHLLHIAQTDRRPLDDVMVQQLLAEHDPSDRLQPRTIIAAVARQFKVTVKDLKGSSRRQAVSLPRGVAMHLLRELAHETYEQIGQHFASRDHTTVMHACQKTRKRLDENPQLQHVVEQLASQLQDAP